MKGLILGLALFGTFYYDAHGGAIKENHNQPKISYDMNDIDYILSVRGYDPFYFKIDVDPQELLRFVFSL